MNENFWMMIAIWAGVIGLVAIIFAAMLGLVADRQHQKLARLRELYDPKCYLAEIKYREIDLDTPEGHEKLRAFVALRTARTREILGIK